MLFTLICHVVSLVSLSIIWLLIPGSVAELLVKVAVVGSFLYLSYQVANILDSLPRFRVSAINKAVLITGCDTGFGHLLAQRLDSIGYKVFAGCLDPKGKGAQDLKDCTSYRIQILSLDVTREDSVKQAVQDVSNNLEECELWAVVNNAGIIVRGELEWTPLEDYRKQFEVNTFGVVRVTQAFLPLLRKSKGRVVTTTSFGGRVTFPGLASYCMSKHASTSFCEGLRMEMKKWDIKVISVEPFSYKSPMTDISTMLQSAEDTWAKAPADLKECYGANYIYAFKECLQKFNNQTANPNIHQVVDTLVEAVTCTSPHFTYKPGDLTSVLLFWLIKRIPCSIGDYIIRKYVTFDCDVTWYLRGRTAKNCIKNGFKKQS